jgi:hypothetical protein
MVAPPAVSLPVTGQAPVIRTDFSDPAAWAAVRAAILAPVGEAVQPAAYVDLVDDPAWADRTPGQIRDCVTAEFAERHRCLFIVDATALTTPGWPVLVVNPSGGKHPVFRAVAEELGGIEANLWMGTVTFSSYAQRAGQTGGVFGAPLQASWPEHPAADPSPVVLIRTAIDRFYASFVARIRPAAVAGAHCRSRDRHRRSRFRRRAEKKLRTALPKPVRQEGRLGDP